MDTKELWFLFGTWFFVATGDTMIAWRDTSVIVLILSADSLVFSMIYGTGRVGLFCACVIIVDMS